MFGRTKSLSVYFELLFFRVEDGRDNFLGNSEGTLSFLGNTYWEFSFISS